MNNKSYEKSPSDPKKSLTKILAELIFLGVVLAMTSDTFGQNIFVTGYNGSENNGTVTEITPNGAQISVASGLNNPSSIVCGSSGQLFVLCGSEIVEISPDGTQSTNASDVVGGLAIDNQGNLYAENSTFNGSEYVAGIVKITPSGTQSTFVTGIAEIGLAFDGEGDLWVLPPNGGDYDTLLSEYSPNGTDLNTVNLGAWALTLAISPSGDLVYGGESGIFELNQQGEKSTLVSGVSASAMVFDGTGNLFVAQNISNNIVKISPSGTLTIVASGVVFGPGFENPRGLALQATTDVPVGSLQVTLNPSAAVSDGAQWQVDDNGTWENSGVTVSGLTPGSHTVTFSTISGWTTPAGQTVTVSANSTAMATGTYVTVSPTGSLQVTISPAGAVSDGAQWQVDNNGAWQNSGVAVSGLSPGSHIVTFSSISGWTTPVSQTVSVSAGEIATVVGVYVIQGTKPSITSQPINQITAVGFNTTLSVIANGTPPLAYHWKRDGVVLSDNARYNGTGTATLTITGAQIANAGSYEVVIGNAFGTVTSSKAILFVDSPPTITKQPLEKTVATGATAIFSVKASGTKPLKYQWQNNGTNLTNVGNIRGVTTATLTILKAQTTDSGMYDVVVTNAVGMAVSSNALLTVNAVQ